MLFWKKFYKENFNIINLFVSFCVFCKFLLKYFQGVKMVILRNTKQINDLVNTIFKLEQTFDENNASFVNEILKEDKLISLLSQTGKIIGKEDLIEELSLLIFQLKDYIPALCNLTNMLLLTKNYDAVYYFTTKLFISHVGLINYQSSGDFNYTERFFDRFIEIVKNCEISPENYIPFILEIFNGQRVGGITKWRMPALEYMKIFYNNNEEWMLNYLTKDKRKFDMMSLLCQFNTQKGLNLSLEFFTKSSEDEDKFLELFKENKKEVLLFVDQKLINANNETLTKFAKILLLMAKEHDAKSRLEEIYKKTDDRNLRNMISQNIGVSDNLSYKNEKQFLVAVRKNVKSYEKNVFGKNIDDFKLKYESGLLVDSAGITFLITLFKQDENLLNLPKYLALKNVFDIESLNEFLNYLYQNAFLKQDINSNLWAVRMVCALCDDLLQDKINNFVVMLFDEGKIKEGKYLLTCLISAQKNDVLTLLKQLIKNENFISNKEEFAKMYAQTNKISVEEILDQLVLDNYTKEEYILQLKRLHNNFIANRHYSKKSFEDIFINHLLFNSLAQKLVFGEYKFGRLYSAFVLENKQIKYIVGKEQEDTDLTISIIHPQDCDMRFQSAYNHFENPTFDQFEEMFYDVKNFSHSSVVINIFDGMMIKPYEFFNQLEKYDFKINKEENSMSFNSFVHTMPSLDLICELELKSEIQLSTKIVTLSNLYFYRMQDVININGKLQAKKQDAIGVGALPYRYFAYILTQILNSIKNSK